jgi:MOSC domain-containing protein
MTICIESMYIAPVKSLALSRVQRSRIGKPGLSGDRAFYIADAAGHLFTQRELPKLVQVGTAYDVDADVLTLTFPDGASVKGVPQPGAAVETLFFGKRPVAGRVQSGGFAEALSSFAGQSLQLVRPETPGSSFDGFPVSMCSMESLSALARAAGRDSIDGRRFRQNIYITGTSAHGEDEWIGRTVRVGGASISVKMPDERCRITTQSPDTGEVDLNTLKIIASYRTDPPKAANFGVYATVIEPGEAAVGDEVVSL